MGRADAVVVDSYVTGEDRNYLITAYVCSVLIFSFTFSYTLLKHRRVVEEKMLCFDSDMIQIEF